MSDETSIIAKSENIAITPGPATFQVCGVYGQPIVVIHADGRVTVSPEYSLDEAAKAFWEAVQKIAEQTR